ncbi:hypothetical protein XI07_15740 [Bradyrhizobium sp. CCBAU 11445]|uniref:hypothetical protein n=1 Tax=unclassified Bradyrhizobium TaxID=2631580 RepID=UPI0023054FA9|nr:MULTISPECIES: hypothetical protein [unclassified Bradyrhizobium]MDA9483439.1 hypothetical protein [Bradyrhizobium sp. CCBAU 11445]MDA9523326.1 hypothetical protein [Bradyrhizobium sp. CCBAU 11434]
MRFITSGTEAMRIVSTGMIGIGTTSPSAALDVTSTVSTVDPIRFGAANGRYIVMNSAAASIDYYGSGGLGAN